MTYLLKQHVFFWKMDFEMRYTLPTFLKERTSRKNITSQKRQKGSVIFPFLKMLMSTPKPGHTTEEWCYLCTVIYSIQKLRRIQKEILGIRSIYYDSKTQRDDV